MDNLLFICTIIGTTVIIVTLFRKVLPKKVIKKIIFSSVIIAFLIVFFNSDVYKHIKYFNEKNFCVTAKISPLVLKRGNQFYYKNYLWIQSCYPKDLLIENISININSEGPITDYEILLADPKEEFISLNTENDNNCSIKIDNLNKEEVVIISLTSSAWLKEPNDVNILLMMKSITVYAEYEFLSRNHKKSVFVSPPSLGEVPNKVLYKDDVIFEKVISLDHRKLPNIFYKYQYYQFLLNNGTKLIKVFCDSKKFIHVYYSGKGQLEYKSDEKISKPTDVIRLLVFKDDFFLSEATFNKHKIQSD